MIEACAMAGGTGARPSRFTARPLFCAGVGRSRPRVTEVSPRLLDMASGMLILFRKKKVLMGFCVK